MKIESKSGGPTERERFDDAMHKILSVSKQELNRRLEEEKKAKGK